MQPTRVLMVCLGNICRSPTAQGVFERLVDARGLAHVIEVDSAGTSNWHVGDPPDPRTVRAAGSRGVDLSTQRGRQVSASDFKNFDYILAMDSDNLEHLENMRPPNYSGHLGLFLDFAPGLVGHSVPDPYHGGQSGFERVLDLCDLAAAGLLEHIAQHRPS